MIVAQHGTRESPCTFFDVSEREHYSSTLDRHFRHVVLSLGFHFDGPTEIGGLVVLPSARGGPRHPGKQLAFVRFLYLAMHRERFRETVLAELMPPLGPGGRSRFWEAFGRRFTDLDYRTADRLSRENKEFIQQLFPPVDVYATLFPTHVRRAPRRGGAGDGAGPAPPLRDRVPLRDRASTRSTADRTTRRSSTTSPSSARTAPVVSRRRRSPARAPRRSSRWSRGEGPNRFRAVRCPARHGRDGVSIPAAARRLLGVKPGERIDLIPF